MNEPVTWGELALMYVCFHVAVVLIGSSGV